jgi:hypothetical protein
VREVSEKGQDKQATVIGLSDGVSDIYTLREVEVMACPMGIRGQWECLGEVCMWFEGDEQSGVCSLGCLFEIRNILGELFEIRDILGELVEALEGVKAYLKNL